MKLIEFIYQEKIDKTGIINSDYTWYDLAKKFNIKEGYSRSQRTKAANDIWRAHKKNQTTKVETFPHPNKDNYDWETLVAGSKSTAGSPGTDGQPFYLELEKEWFPDIPYKEDGVYIILGCVHVPFYNREFMKAALRCISTLDVKGLILNGDFLDLNTLSFYDKGKNPLEGINLGVEYEQGNKLLDVLESALPKDIYKAYLYGNHEDRFWRHMKSIDFAKLKGAVKSPTEAMRLVERGYEILEDWANDEIQIGDLTIIHGEFCSTHTCKSHLDTYKKNMLFAHTHRVQMYREGEHVAYNIGSMADFDSPAFNYASKSMKKRWSNGFAIATVVNGKTSVEQIIWQKDHFIYGGKVWKV